LCDTAGVTTDSGAFELEEELKRTNPKGRLWDACAARALRPPTIHHGRAGDRHRVEMELAYGEWELRSGVQWGRSRKVAEQLAAQVLLDELAALEHDEPAVRVSGAVTADDDVFEVTAEDVARQRKTNPKGQVYEWCQKQRPPVRRPRFETRKVPGGVLWVRGRLDALEVSSPWFATQRRKDGEQAAAEALLGLLPVGEGAPAVDAIATANPRTVLNDLMLHGPLAECQVEVIDQQGPAHAPVFTAQGWARFSDGREVRGASAEGSSKRQAITAASRALLALVDER